MCLALLNYWVGLFQAALGDAFLAMFVLAESVFLGGSCATMASSVSCLGFPPTSVFSGTEKLDILVALKPCLRHGDVAL